MGKTNTKIKKLFSVSALAVVLAFSVSNLALASAITPQTVIGLVNQARLEKGLKALEENSKLSEAAADKAEDMIKNNYFAHNSPKGITPWFWIEKNKYDYTYAGENLAMDFTTAEKEQSAWMKSESHKKNILNPNYQEIGVAVRQGMINKRLTTVAVQEFGSRTDFVASKNPVIVSAPKNELAKVLGEEQNKINVPINLTPQPNASLSNSFDANMVKISDSAIKSFQYAKRTLSSPGFMDSITLSAYAVLIAIILVINPLVMLYLLALILSRKFISAPSASGHTQTE